jgi:hypothetical protein
MFGYIKVAVVAVLLATPASAQSSFWDNYNRAYSGGPVTQPQPQQQRDYWEEERQRQERLRLQQDSQNRRLTIEPGWLGHGQTRNCRQQGSLIFCD